MYITDTKTRLVVELSRSDLNRLRDLLSGHGTRSRVYREFTAKVLDMLQDDPAMLGYLMTGNYKLEVFRRCSD